MNNSARVSQFSNARWRLSACQLVLPLVAHAQFTFTTNNNAITIAGYTGSGGDLVIPSTTNSYPVTCIGNYAFAGCTNLLNVTIPDSVISIGNGAFKKCASLTNVAIGNSVASIGAVAFANCSNLAYVTIPNSVASIGTLAFFSCPSLTAAYFFGNAPQGDYMAFAGDSGTVYYLPGTMGWSSGYGGWPTALWYQPKPSILDGGIYISSATPTITVRFGFTISWATNTSVVVEANTNLANPVWIPVSTNALTGGASSFRDEQWTNYPARYYRLRSP